ncbi:MAG TPA: S8 family serine peptidase [Usitatibacter sp.]|nr:S8 family serine peptidase [Usitatibacter sp.]
MKIPHRLSWSVGACVALAFGVPAVAQEISTEALKQLEAQPSAKKAANSTYIVQLRESPAVAYDGGVAGLKATRPAKGKKIDPESPAVVDYVSYLQARHDALLAQHGGGNKLYSYGYAFNGFAAKMTPAQARKLAQSPDVVKVWKDEERSLDTNRTPSFLGLTNPGGLWSQLGGVGKAGEDIIIGMVDSGFWPENPSFSDRDADGKLVYQNVVHWPGKCHPGEAFNASHCNQKVIGARYYNAGFGGDAAVKARFPNDFNSPRDGAGHGSHTASTAGGNANTQAVVHGVSLGAISGIAPRARLSIYKSCYGNAVASSCFNSDSVAAIDQAVADGVDVLNFSIGGSTSSNIDAVQVAFLFAVDAGVFVAAAAGNDGVTSSVAHNAPWMTTVAAGTHDRVYSSGVNLGNNQSYFGVSVGGGTPTLPTILAQDAGAAGMPADQVAQCWSNNTGGGLNPPTGPAGNRLDPAKVAGKIVVCDRGGNARVDKSEAVRAAGGRGVILANVVSSQSINPDPHVIPTVHVTDTVGATIKAYVGGSSSPTSSLVASVITGGPAAPNVAGFSSRGPALASGGNVLKPDIMAPGVDVLAAYSPVVGNTFDFLQGTSMASPHIAGIAALFKQRQPGWSPAMIKSALMTTASQLRTDGSAIPGGVFDFGAGHVAPNPAVDPGLVFDAGFIDWLGFLCGTGELTGAGCAPIRINPSNLNYPSMAIGSLPGRQTVTRTVQNVGAKAAKYTATTMAPAGLSVTVSPSTLDIAPGGSATYSVTFDNNTAALNAYATGAVTWSDGAHSVRSPFAVKPVILQYPEEVVSTGEPVSYGVTFGYNGNFAVLSRGLVKPNAPIAGTVQDDPDNDYVRGGKGTVEIPVTIPSGTTVARFALFDSDMAGAHDLDMYVYFGDSLVGVSAGGTSNEVVTFAAAGAFGTTPLTVVIHGFETDGPSADFKLQTWYAGASTGTMTSTATPTVVSKAQAGTVSATFGNLAPNTRYVGGILHRRPIAGQPTASLSTTVISVNTP